VLVSVSVPNYHGFEELCRNCEGKDCIRKQ